MRAGQIFNKYFFGHLAVVLTMIALKLFLYDSIQKEIKATEVTAQTTILSKYFYDAGLAVGAYSLTRNKIFSERYITLADRIPSGLEKLHQLIQNQPTAARQYSEIKQTIDQGLNELLADKQMVESGTGSLLEDQGSARKAYKQIKLIADTLQQQLDQLSAEEEQIARRASQLRFVFLALSSVVLLAYAAYNYIAQTKANRT